MSAPAAPPPAVVAPRSSVGPLRHLASLVVAMLATPVGMVVLDLGNTRGLRYQETLQRAGALGLLEVAVGGLLLLVAAASGRLSGLGPLLAGLVWGGGPLAWLLLSPRSFYEAVFKLPKTNSYPFFSGEPYALFAAVLAMLLGCAVAGRWR